jgi:hypothetical protein
MLRADRIKIDGEIAHDALDDLGAQAVVVGQGLAARGGELALRHRLRIGRDRHLVLHEALRQAADRAGAEAEQDAVLVRRVALNWCGHLRGARIAFLHTEGARRVVCAWSNLPRKPQFLALAQEGRCGFEPELGIDSQAKPAMCCCQIPPPHDFRPDRREAAGAGTPGWMWASFAVGIAFLSLSLTTAILLAVRL